MKKVFAIALAVVMLLSVVLGCGSKKKETPPAPSQTKVTESQNKASSNAVKAADKDKQDINAKQQSETKDAAGAGTKAKVDVVKGKAYTDKDHVAAYIHVYKTLPPNYITKREAQDLGWVSSAGNLWKVAPGKSIGGDYFGNYEKQLPVVPGRKYYEADCFYFGGDRNEYRIIYSNDGHVWYTEDHYNTFIELFPTKD